MENGWNGAGGHGVLTPVVMELEHVHANARSLNTGVNHARERMQMFESVM